MNVNSRIARANFTGYASGAIASFTGLKAAPIKVVAQIVPIQSGSGDPAPDNIRPIIGASECNVVRCGKNLFDGIFPEIGALVKYRQFKVNNGTYTFSTTCPLNSENAANIFAFGGYVTSGGSTAVNGLYQNMPRTVTTTDGYITLAYRKTSVNPEDYNTQIELGSTATAYEAYTSNTYTIQLGDTYYGGSLDVTSGVLTVTHANIASYNGEPINEPWICSEAVYSEGTTPPIGSQVVYPLATPQTIQLTPTQIEQIIGTNNIYADTGNVKVFYVTV